MAFFPTLTVGANTYNGIDMGEYFLTTSTTDEPIKIQVLKPSIKADSTSFCGVEYVKATNNSTTGQDNILKVRFSYTWSSNFANTDLHAAQTELVAMQTAANLLREMRGER